jgi:uncharacterized protein DUF6328
MADQSEPDAEEQFSALLEGLRATLPGVEVLFAFLLVLPFQNGFSKLETFEKRLYAIAFGAAGVALILLIAPSVHQRVRVPFSGVPRRHVRHVRAGAYLGLAGSVAASVALATSAWLAVAVVYGNGIAVTFAVVLASLVAWAWFWIPLVSFRDDNRSG